MIDFMPGQNDEINKGGTLRLGRYPCILAGNTVTYSCYAQKEIIERHLHRYEVNNNFRKNLTDVGVVLSGLSPDGNLVETMVMLKCI